MYLTIALVAGLATGNFLNVITSIWFLALVMLMVGYFAEIHEGMRVQRQLSKETLDETTKYLCSISLPYYIMDRDGKENMFQATRSVLKMNLEFDRKLLP